MATYNKSSDAWFSNADSRRFFLVEADNHPAACFLAGRLNRGFGHLQTFFLPEPLYPLVIDNPPSGPQQRRDLPVPVTPINVQ